MLYRTMVSSIQVSGELKDSLSRMKGIGQSYEDVIMELIVSVEKQKSSQEELLIEGYKEMAEDSLRLCKGMEGAGYDLDWEWKD